MTTLPKTHIELVSSQTAKITNTYMFPAEMIGKEVVINLYKAGIAHHNNTYTPHQAYYTECNGVVVRFTGKTAKMRAMFDIASLIVDME